jgi:hypothetical protein
MRRRALIRAALAMPFAAAAQALAQPLSGRGPRVGILTPAGSDQTLSMEPRQAASLRAGRLSAVLAWVA